MNTHKNRVLKSSITTAIILKVYLFIFLVAGGNNLLWAGVPDFQVPATWVNVGSAGFSAGDINAPSIAIDTKGTPYVVFSDVGNTYKASMMKYDGKSWGLVGSAGFSSDYAYVNAIAIDNNDIPYFAYQDSDADDLATVMKFNGSWITVGTAGFSDADADYINFAIDTNNIPYVVYGGNANKATVMKFDTNWSTVGTVGFTSNAAAFTKIAIDANNIPYVAYLDASTHKANLMKFTSTTWNTVGTTDFAFASTMSIAINSNNIPYVAYVDQGTYKSTVMKYNGSWSTVGSANFTADVTANTDLAIDSSDTPYVVFRDGANSDKATVMKFDGSVWNIVGTAGFSANNVDSTTIAIDNSDTLYVAYTDHNQSTLSSKATVKKFVQQFNIQENTTDVGVINAIDPEVDPITYSITGGDSAYFSIHSDTGVLNFKTAPDFENPMDTNEDNIYAFTVIASANGDDVRKQVHITVTDDSEESNLGFLSSVIMFLLN